MLLNESGEMGQTATSDLYMPGSHLLGCVMAMKPTAEAPQASFRYLRFGRCHGEFDARNPPAAIPAAIADPVALSATINPASVYDVSTNGGTVTFKNGSTVLGTGTLASGVATLTTSALPVGSDSIVATFAGFNGFSSTTSNPFSQTVRPATLTVTGENASRPYGAPNPALSGTVSGAVNGDTFSVTASTTATQTSPVASYPVVPKASGAHIADYNVVTANGSLKVTQATQAITFTPSSPVPYGVSPITLSAIGGASGNPATFSIVSGPGSLSGTNNSILTVTGGGTIVVAANQAGNSNYAAAPQVTKSIVVDQLAALTSPAPGNTLTGSSATFTWSAGVGVTMYEFRLGTTGPGSTNLYNAAEAGTTALTSGLISNIPATGATLYARLYSLIDGAWQYKDYTYIEFGAPVPAALTSPTPGSTLTGSSATFTWSAGVAVTMYEFRLGTTGPGSTNLYNSAEAGTTALTSGLISNIPTTSATLYARLYSLIGGAWQYKDYTYTESGPAMLTSPTPGSTLTGSSATFTWSAGGGVTMYEFRLGTTGPGSTNLYNAAEAGTTALTSGLISNIPTNAAPLYARLYSLIKGAWQYKDYTYTEFGTPVPAALTSPTAGSILTGSSATFTWSAGTGVTMYEVPAGHSRTRLRRTYNSAEAGTTALTSGLISNIPTKAAPLYARLYSLIEGAWQYKDYTYTEFGTPVPAALTSPTPSSILAGSSATFTWSAGTGVTMYGFRLGTTGPGSTNLYNSAEAGTTALTSGLISNIPTTGATLYARLYSLINGAWQYKDYTYTAQ